MQGARVQIGIKRSSPRTGAPARLALQLTPPALVGQPIRIQHRPTLYKSVGVLFQAYRDMDLISNSAEILFLSIHL